MSTFDIINGFTDQREDAVLLRAKISLKTDELISKLQEYLGSEENKVPTIVSNYSKQIINNKKLKR